MKTSSTRRVVPDGDTLPPESWARRHRAIVGLLWLHAVGLPVYGIATGLDLLHALLEGGLAIMALALAASSSRVGRRARSVLATLGLVTASAVLVHFSDGLIEMHFHFFVVVTVVGLYQSWRPFLTALIAVLVHHGVMGMLAPERVYNHPAALEAPWAFALLHSGFVLAAAIASLVSWRLSEDALERERHARYRLTEVTEALHRAQALADIGNWSWDPATSEVTASEQLVHIMGLDPGAALTAARFGDLVHPDDRAPVTMFVEGAGSTALDVECRIVRSDGDERVVHLLGHFTQDEPGTPRHAVGTCQDITGRRALEREVEWRAFHDHLTGLANRALYLDRLEHALTGRRSEGAATVVLFLDLDGFKAINDRLGHRVGDQLLIEVANRLQGVCRSGDTVARFGGDEFAIVCEEMAPVALELFVERIEESLARPVTITGEELPLAHSIGVASSEDVGGPHDADELLQHADLAMYAAKRRGVGGVERFHPRLVAEARARLDRVREFEHGRRQGQFVALYQPIVDLATGATEGLEALVHWAHPDRGLLPASEFIHLAEESGQVAELGAWMIHEAFQGIADARAAGRSQLRLHVDIAASQLTGELVTTVRSALSASELTADDLTVEITESALLGDTAVASVTIASLAALGVRIALDDFGAGYSSFAHLELLPLDMLKIDRSFVAGVTDSADRAALVSAIVRLADVLGVRTVATGVDTPAQRNAMHRLGCRSGQGLLYSVPVPLGQLLTPPVDVR